MKLCSKCKTEKPVEDFNRWSRGKDGRQPYCRFCASAYYHANEIKHKGVVYARKRQIIGQNQRRVCEYLDVHPCVECNENDVVVLDFDHVRGVKLGNICSMVTEGCSWAKITAEIAKCEVRCANCHRRKTAKERGFFKHTWVGSLMAKPQTFNLSD